MTLPQGLYDRLINEDEVASLDGIAAAFSALIEKPSRAQQREHLISTLTARLPELLDIVANGAKGDLNQLRAELQLIA
jgi:hypothetical protein